MILDWSEYTRFTIALATIIDPIAVVPIFLNSTAHFSMVDRRRTARLAGLAVGLVLIAAATAFA